MDNLWAGICTASCQYKRGTGLEPELHVHLPLAGDPIEVGVLSRKEGYPVRDEDVAWLSPLIDDHINLLGRYSFTVPESVSRGELRLLHNSAEQDD